MALKTFNCPACSGPLEYTREAGQLVNCKFCGQNVMVPAHLRGESAVPTVVVPARASRLILGVVVSFVAMVSLGIFFVVRSATEQVTSLPPIPPVAGLPAMPALPAAPEAKGFEVVLAFGEEGIGPGRFEDARHIAVDGDGYVYVGEYQGGRVQRFDAEGKFQTQWLVDPEIPLRGLAADRQGIVYAVQRGEIRRYRGATGEALGPLAVPGRFRADGVYLAPDGGLLAFGGGASPAEVVRLGPDGRVRLRIETSAHNGRAAIDGLGNVYVIGSFSERGKQHTAVIKYDADGTYLNRFGGAGSEPGQFRATHTIAVDNQGRVYVSDIDGLEVFDAEGRFLRHLAAGPTVFGMTFADDDALWIVERNAHEVRKLRLDVE